jgi:hypothetical protein
MNLEDDPVFQLLVSGEATTLAEAEDLWLGRSLPEIMALLGSDLSNEEVEKHPLLVPLTRMSTRPAGGARLDGTPTFRRRES